MTTLRKGQERMNKVVASCRSGGFQKKFVSDQWKRNVESHAAESKRVEEVVVVSYSPQGVR